MSGLTGLLIVGGVLAVSYVGWRWNVRSARRHGSARARFVAAVHNQAEAARLLDPVVLADDGLEDDLPLEVKAHLFGFGFDNPDIADGFARLEQAIRDSRTNTPEGEA